VTRRASKPTSRASFGRTAIAIALAGAVVAACGDDGDDGGADDGGSAVIVTTTTSTSPATAPPTDPTTTGAATAPTPTPASVPPTTPDTPPATTAPPTVPPTTTLPPTVGDPRVAASSIGTFDDPVAVRARPGDPALYVVEQPGRVVRFDTASGERRTVVDIADQVSFSGEQGLLGLAFSLDGALGYLHFSDNAGDTTLVEYPVTPDGTFDVAAGRLLLQVEQPYGNHNGGDLETSPDGLLLLALGDGGSGGDPQRFADDPRSLLGTIVRIDPSPSGAAPYTVPADNPFASGTFGSIEGAPEVYAWGLRNPWRIDLDPVTGELWIADVGQNRMEEVNRVAPTAEHPAGWGLDFGWSAYEGTDRFNTDVADPGTLTFPVLTYLHGDDGCSVSGGAVYRGTAIPELEPAYVYSDFCSGKIWALDLAGGRNLTLIDRLGDVVSVDRGPDGELYVVERSGAISRLVPA
jgi:glucose/arabinose dehydrogenase